MIADTCLPKVDGFTVIHAYFQPHHRPLLFPTYIIFKERSDGKIKQSRKFFVFLWQEP
jgi:hypothetical protein